MVAAECACDLGCRMLWIDESGSCGKLTLQQPELFFANLFELVQWGIHHVFIVDHSAKGIGADRVSAPHLWPQNGAEPCPIVIDRGNRL